MPTQFSYNKKKDEMRENFLLPLSFKYPKRTLKAMNSTAYSIFTTVAQYITVINIIKWHTLHVNSSERVLTEK